MCGIAGRILSAPGNVGRDLVALMAAQEHRGADSTGFAIYGNPMENGYVLRGMGFDKSNIDADLAAFRTVLKDHGSDLISDPAIVSDADKHYCFRIEITDPKNLAAWVADADELSGSIEIQSCGRSLEIIKDVGGAEQVSEKHNVHDMIGSHGLGHARLAT